MAAGAGGSCFVFGYCLFPFCMISSFPERKLEGKSMLFYKLGFVPMNLVNVIELKLEFEENMVSCVLLFISIHIHTVPFGHATRNHNRLAL